MAKEAERGTLPDLVGQGVTVEDIEAAGGMLLGDAGGEKVLLTRLPGELCAVGATCTHYGGPLQKGLVVDGTVRCPWHHACFDLRTGEALGAPALKPIPRWNVREAGGRIYVEGKEKLGALEPTARSREALHEPLPQRVVVVGGGAAGGAAVEMLRRTGFGAGITLIDPEPAAPYDRPNLSKDYLAGDAPESWIPLRSDEFYAENEIELVRQKVKRIDTEAKEVRLQDGSSLAYDALLLTTGSEPRKLDTPGHDLPHVHVLRSLQDSRAIIEAAEKADAAVVIGASFIGLEVAASLRERGLSVDVVAPDERPLAKVMGPEIGAMIQELHEEHGVKFHLGHTAAKITPTTVELDDGTTVAASLVVIGVGVSPRVRLAEEAGLEVDHGVVVDEYLQTSVEGVFAAGDIARWPDPRAGHPVRVEHWVVAQRLGQAAARNLLGAREPFTDVPFFWSKHYDLSIRYSGHAEGWDRIDVAGSVAERDFSAAFRKGGKTLAVASVKRDHENLRAAAALEDGDEEMLRQLIPADG